MSYEIDFSSMFSKQIWKLKKKDPLTFARVMRKLQEIGDRPEHFKPLRNKLKGTRRAHIDPYVIVFSIEETIIRIHYVKHHDEAY